MPKKLESPLQGKPQIRNALRDMGQRIAFARKGRGWSQSELGQRLGNVDRRHVSAMEKGSPDVGVGLVVAALWLLDIPVLARVDGPSTTTGDLFPASLSSQQARRRSRGRRNPPREISNDF